MKTLTNKIAPPVALWGLLQLALLGIGATGVPLWAHHPFPRESLAIQEMLCGQLVFIAMLFPILGGSIWAMAMNLCLMLPFDALAALLSATPTSGLIRGYCATSLWLIGLASWKLRFKNNPICEFVAVGAILITVGGAFLDYLRWEANLAEGGTGSFQPHSVVNGICRLLVVNDPLTWLEFSIPLALVVISSIPSTLLHQRQKTP